MIKALIEFNKDDLDVFTGGSIGVPLTEKEGALISGALFLILNRGAWAAMSDSEWDSWNSYLASVIEKVTP